MKCSSVLRILVFRNSLAGLSNLIHFGLVSVCELIYLFCQLSTSSEDVILIMLLFSLVLLLLDEGIGVSKCFTLFTKLSSHRRCWVQLFLGVDRENLQTSN